VSLIKTYAFLYARRKLFCNFLFIHPASESWNRFFDGLKWFLQAVRVMASRPERHWMTHPAG
jgi:hypothetical protein